MWYYFVMRYDIDRQVIVLRPDQWQFMGGSPEADSSIPHADLHLFSQKAEEGIAELVDSVRWDTSDALTREGIVEDYARLNSIREGLAAICLKSCHKNGFQASEAA